MITGVVLARNEEENIVACVQSLLPHVGEVILIDMESTDKTVQFVRPYVTKVLSHPLIANFDSARNIAIPEARYDWLWFLDADERIPVETGRLINEIVRQRGSEAVAITIPFKSYFCGQWVQHSGWWPGYTMPRVLKRGHFAFGDRLHSGVQFDGVELRIAPDPKLAIEHFSYRSIEHYVEKLNRYTTTEALNLAEQCSCRLTWENGVRSLVRDLWLYYERNEGHEDGYLGWILAWLAGQYRWFSHAKLADIPTFRTEVESAAVPKSLDEVFAVMQHELSRLRAANTNPQFGLVFHTPLFDPSGYAEDARMLLKAASLGNRPLAAIEHRWNDVKCQLPDADVALFRALTRANPPIPTIKLANCIPTLVEPDPYAEFNVLRTTFETDRVPDFWLPHIERFDEVWVLSRHNAVAFRRSGVAPERIRVLPEFIDTSLFSPQGRKLPLPAQLRNRFVFLSVLDWQQRKGWDVLIRAYCEEFTEQDRVGLLLKITKLHGYSLEQVRTQISDLLNSLGQNSDARPDICLWDALLEQTEMAALYRSVEAFALASRGEGWGRPYMEAMATGLPTIGTRGSGNEDFMDDTTSFMVDTMPVPVPESAAAEIPVYRGHVWKEPDLSGLRKAMRSVYRDRRQASRVGQKASASIRKSFSLTAGKRVLEEMITSTEQKLCPQPSRPIAAGQIRVELEGEFFAGHSFSNINEQLATILTDDKRIALALKRVYHNPVNDQAAVHAGRLRAYFGRSLSEPADVVIRHAFPPNWKAPEHGRWVHIQPWEFGSLPRDWVPPLRDLVDEIWCPSNYVKEVYLRSGILGDKVIVIPWGIDPSVYSPDVPPLHLPIDAGFKFLYVGGSVHRKGIDTLLRAYVEEFYGERDVCLIIKDLGTKTFYRYGNYRERILELIPNPSAPPMVYIEKDMTDGQRASLYAACDCLVAPYRGEGFGLPVLEAMACGVPPIVPRGGATDDFVSNDDGYFLPATLVECDHDWRLCGPATELAIAVDDLRRAMREAYEHRDGTRGKGKAAAERVRSKYTWHASAERMTERIQSLAGKEPCDRRNSVACAKPAVAFPLDLTVCLATHNHERTIADCLARVQPFVREIVVADTQSNDRTVAIAREYGARVYSIPPSDDHSAVRNLALRRATSEWILSIDPDELLGDGAMEEIAALLAEQPPRVAGFSMRASTTTPGCEENEIRIFRNHNQIFYEGSGLERVDQSIRRLGGQVIGTNLILGRAARSNGHTSDVLRLIHRDVAEKPKEPQGFFRLGLAHFRTGNFFHAECYLNEFLLRIDQKHGDYFAAAKRLIGCYRAIDDPIRAQQWETRLEKNGEAQR